MISTTRPAIAKLKRVQPTANDALDTVTDTIPALPRENLGAEFGVPISLQIESVMDVLHEYSAIIDDRKQRCPEKQGQHY